MKKLSVLLLLAAGVLSHMAVGMTAYSWASMECAIAHGGASAPASTALLLLIPYGLGAALLTALGLWCRKKSR